MLLLFLFSPGARVLKNWYISNQRNNNAQTMNTSGHNVRASIEVMFCCCGNMVSIWTTFASEVAANLLEIAAEIVGDKMYVLPLDGV